MMQFFSFLTACDFCSFSSKAAQQHLNDHPKNFSSFGRFLSFRLEKASRRKKITYELEKAQPSHAERRPTWLLCAVINESDLIMYSIQLGPNYTTFFMHTLKSLA